MKLTDVLGAIGGGAAVLKGAATSTLVFGAIYLTDCRLTDKDPGGRDRCYLQAATFMGIGGMTGIGYSIGYGTYNPTLRRPEEGVGSGAERNEQGFFKRK